MKLTVNGEVVPNINAIELKFNGIDDEQRYFGKGSVT